MIKKYHATVDTNDSKKGQNDNNTKNHTLVWLYTKRYSKKIFIKSKIYSVEKNAREIGKTVHY